MGSSDKENIKSLPIFDTATIKLCLSSTFKAFNILDPCGGFINALPDFLDETIFLNSEIKP